MAFENLKKTGITYVLTRLKDYFLQIKDAVKSVNNTFPDENGNIPISRVDFAGDLESSSTQYNSGEFILRTSGGSTPIKSGDAWLSDIKGKAVKTGYVEEVLNDPEVIPIDPESQTAIAVSAFDRTTFKSVVTQSSVITLLYTTGWSENPATYGIELSGTAAAGDQIVITYVKGELGTLTFPVIDSFVSTGWNLYKTSADYSGYTGFARVVNYSSSYGFRAEGTFTSLKFSATLSGTKSDLTITSGNITAGFPENWTDGYIWVVGGNSTDTAIYMTWSDWTEGYNWSGDAEGEFSAYDETTIDLSGLFDPESEDSPFPYGLLACGSAQDEINLNTGMAISRVERMANTAENQAAAQDSGREWDMDENYIYLVRATAVSTPIELDGAYVVNDHGLEYFTGTTVPVETLSIYGNSLKNKLELDVLTKSADLVNNLTTNDSTKALSAAQGYALNSNFTIRDIKSTLSSSVATIDSAYSQRTGSLVVVQLRFTLTSAVTASTDVISGFERSYDNYGGLHSFRLYDNTASNFVDAQVTHPDGAQTIETLRFFGSVQSGHSIRGTFMYIAI